MSKIPGCIFILILSFFSTGVNAQSCFNVNAGKDTTISCSQSCLDLKARIPNIKSTEDYSVIAIPYAPYPYKTPFGTESALVYDDDHFSDSFTLPFPFCFYGSTYNQTCVGSNGVITFDVKTNANKIEGYFMRPGDRIPFTGGAPNVQDMYYAPRASIFLGYYDMNPLTSAPKRKIEWRVEGTAPCRKFVVSYFQIGNYDVTNCPNLTNLCTMQAVLYEGTGIIDIFYENKPACRAYQDGLAIAGIQNWNQDLAVPLPGKNSTVWTAINEGYRYVPNGSNSLLKRVQVFKNNVLIGGGTTTDLGNGELEATFSNICQPEDSMSYVVKAFYQQCDNPLVETEGSDTIIVYKTFSNFKKNITDAACNGGDGTITILSPVSNNIEYSIDGGASWQPSNIFSKPAGNYTIIAKLVGLACNGSTSATITEPPALNVITDTTAATCSNNDGIITIAATGGTPAYQYSIDNGLTWQSSNVFTVASGNYNNIKIKDVNSCITSSTAVVRLDDQMFLNAGTDTTICFGSSITFLPQTNPGTAIFKWMPAASLNDAAIKNPAASPADTTLYTLTAKWGPCQRTDDILVKVLHKPIAYAGKDSIICNKTAAFLNGNAGNLSGTVNYAWSPSTNVTPANFRIAIAKPDSTQVYILTVTDNYGCNFSVTDEVLITVRPKVPAFAGNDTTAVYGVPHQMLGSGGQLYNWSPSTPLNNPFAQRPLATLYNDTYFTLLVTDDIGCTNTDDVLIKVYKGPTYYIPNAFTPNGDGDNDIFRAVPVGISVTDFFNVYNRFGEMVFQTNQWLKGWDGTIKGKKAAAGTYVWVIKGIDRYGKTIEMKGTVILLR